MQDVMASAAVFEEMRRHGESAYPEECCGVLLGELRDGEWAVSASARAKNVAGVLARSRYSIAPLELVRIEREARSAGLEIAGFYHSHPDHPAMWSRTDLAEAHWFGCLYVITAVASGVAGETNGFLLAGECEEEKRFLGVGLRVG